MDRWEIERIVVMQALKDPAFKKQLEASPEEALLKLFENNPSVDLSKFKGIKVRVNIEAQSEFTISIPYINGKINEAIPEDKLQQLFVGNELQYSPDTRCMG